MIGMKLKENLKDRKHLILPLFAFSLLTSFLISFALDKINSFFSFFFYIFFTTLLFLFVWDSVLNLVYPGRIERKEAVRLYLFIVFVSVTFILVFVVFYEKVVFANLNLPHFVYATGSPLFLSGVFSSMILGNRSYVLVVVNTAIVSSLIANEIPFFGEMVAFSSIMAGEVSLVKKGPKGFLNGILGGTIALFVMVTSVSFVENYINYALLFSPFFSAVGVLFSIYALVPVVEHLFGIVADIKLLEYANINHPLLKELMDKAPGTYNHSVIVSLLAEAAAYEIGANPIIAKVGALFHDIGKIKNPKYFIENTGSVSYHEKLSPSMSRLIILSHVRDGVELVKKYHFPKCIVEIVEQHHGTSLIRYFYEKAKKVTKESVSEEIYRYPGPKPRTKEAAIVMMADSVEAAVRSVSEATPAKIKDMIKIIVSNLFADGQLDESPITFKEVKIVADVFLRMLISFYHKRISYPGQDSNGGNNSSRS